MRQKNPDTIYCERVHGGVLYQAYGREVRLIALSESVLDSLRKTFKKSQKWDHAYENAVVRKFRDGEKARLEWVSIAPDTAITPPKKERGTILPIRG